MHASDIPRSDKRFIVSGLTDEVEVLVDRWGVPHIYANDIYDAFRAQGFNAARERLWQIDFWRRRGLGLLAEVFGEQYVERDRAARLFLYRGEMHEEWLRYGSDTKRVVTAFVEGVNSFVELTRNDSSMLPEEFGAIGYLPSFWSPEDLPRIRSHGLFNNVRNEVGRALTVRDYGVDVEQLRRRVEPDRPVTVPEGLALDEIPDDVLDVYLLATSAVLPTPSGPAEPAQDSPPEGSNNWVISGRRTATGRPILANDPHRAAAVLPGLRYISHLSAPGLDVIGAGEPALPGISIGHNGQIAFGLTIFSIDQEDLYVYELSPGDPTRYWYNGTWEQMTLIEDVIHVPDGTSRPVELQFTRHGPVIRIDVERNRAYAVRAAWLQPGMAPYLGSMDYMRARDWHEFEAALNRWGAPGENQVFADTAGNIGWKAAGLTPKRPNWDGMLPVPGDGSYEWSGFYDMDELPGTLNPECGWLATANEMNLPEAYPADRHISYDWGAPYRYERIRELLSTAENITVAQMAAMQNDLVSMPAQRLIAAVVELGIEPTEADGMELLKAWDGELSANSAAAAFFEVWYRRHLRPGLLRRALGALVPDVRVDPALACIDFSTEAREALDIVETPERHFGPDGRAVLREIMVSSLATAWADLIELLGPDPAAWEWGQLLRVRARHPLFEMLPDTMRQRAEVGPMPRGGSGDTVGLAEYGPDFYQISGATFRVVIDVGEWDNSLAMNAPGQSGVLGDVHATDLFGDWARGSTFPLLYSRAAVTAEKDYSVLLSPLTSAERP